MVNEEHMERMLTLSMNNIQDTSVHSEQILVNSSIIDTLCNICKTYDRGYLGSEVCKECYWKSSDNHKSHDENNNNRVASLEESNIHHPSHYGGNTTYEHIKVVEAWGLNYALASATKYICRAGKKSDNSIEDLNKALFWINHEIRRLS